jgi:RimJ/RimL family protein N-acetyltransferase
MTIYAETERLILRELLPTDDAGMFALDSDPEVHRFLGNRPVMHISEAQHYIAFVRQQYLDNGIGRWAVIEKATGAFMGWSGLKLVTEMTNGHERYLDIGYRFIRRYWGQGYATESAIAARNYAFGIMNASVVYGAASVANMASRHVLEKIGMTYVNDYYWQDIPCRWYELTKENYRKLI